VLFLPYPALKYDAFKNLTSENFKGADMDLYDYELYKVKTNEKLNKFSKVTTNFQKEVSELQTV
jgi:hypothetical protein